MTLSELTLGIFQDDPYAALDVEIPISTHPHPRARIRDFIVRRLRAAALQPAKISVNRAAPAALASTPIVLVYLLREATERFIEGPLTYARPMQLALHVVIHESQALPVGASIDDVVDGFCEVFEAILLCDVNDRGQWFGAQAAACELGETVLEPETDGERVFLHSRTVFEITYQREPGRPVVENPLRRIHAEWDLAPSDGRIDAVDEIQMPISSALAGVIHVTGDFSGTVGP